MGQAPTRSHVLRSTPIQRSLLPASPRKRRPRARASQSLHPLVRLVRRLASRFLHLPDALLVVPVVIVVAPAAVAETAVASTGPVPVVAAPVLVAEVARVRYLVLVVLPAVVVAVLVAVAVPVALVVAARQSERVAVAAAIAKSSSQWMSRATAPRMLRYQRAPS